MEFIKIRGARTHNLKNINLDLPRNRLTVITGLSGSGKSSLAFDTLYAEGQRRYVESLSAYARQFLQLMEKPDVDLIEGLSPAIAIEQKATSHNPRSTVGTVTEIHDYLRLLYARAGTPHTVPDHDLPLEANSVSQMVDHVLALPEDTKLMILAPVVADRKGEQLDLFAELRAQGFVRLRVDGKVHDIDALPNWPRPTSTASTVVVDRLKVRPDVRQRLAESFETALRHADGRALAVEMDTGKDTCSPAKFACPVCSYSLQELEPRLFSFNNPMGACPKCDGLGQIQFFDPARVVAYPHLSLPRARSRAGTGATSSISRCWTSLAAHYTNSTPMRPFEKLPVATATSCSTARARRRSSSATSTSAARASTAGMPSRASFPTWSGATAKPIRWRCARSCQIPQQQALPRMPRHAPAARGAPRRVGGKTISDGQPPIADPVPRLLQPAAACRPRRPRSARRSSTRSPRGCPS
jgi:excinuclease ABC subunit A